MAPRLVMPADNLGFGGFQVSGELALTRISRDRSYWNAAEGVARENPAVGRPPEWLSTAGAFVRKGLWLGLPAFEVGAGVVNLLESNLLSWQGYGKLALHEGFHDQPFPSLAVRGSVGLPDRHRPGAHDRQQLRRHPVQALRGDGHLPDRALRRLELPAHRRPVAAGRRHPVLRRLPGTHRATGGASRWASSARTPSAGTDNDEMANFRFPKQSAHPPPAGDRRGQAEVRHRVPQRANTTCTRRGAAATGRRPTVRATAAARSRASL